ncbi:MAG: response regulator [Deltaproteobacteria bacterium]|nr:response regulator [Deltaproteobacteria bacterium]
MARAGGPPGDPSRDGSGGPYRPATTYPEWQQQFLLRRGHVAAWVALIGNLSFVAVDALTYAAHLSTLLVIRAVVEVALAAGLVALHSRFGQRRPALAAFSLAFSIGLGIAHMTPYVGGFRSTYYAGLNLVFLGFAVLVPVRWRLHVLLQLAVLTYYFTVNALFGPPPAWRAALLDNGVFILWTCIICDLSVLLYERLQRAEFEGRQALEAANANLRELDRLKNEFYANVSHELRTPLTLIVSAFRGLGSAADAGDVHAISQTGLRNASRLLLLINELLDLAKLDSGRAAPSKRVVDLAALVRHVAANFDSSGLGRRVRVEGAEDPLAAQVDPGQLKKVLYNLLSNAFKFSDPETGRVRVSLRASADHAVLEVEDNGIGIPRDQLGRIFERFTQVEGSATRRYEGTGIGLALVRELVDRHGGTVTVHSEVGVGSTFNVTVPRGDVSAGIEEAATDEDHELVDFLQRTVRRGATAAAEDGHPEARSVEGAPLLLIVEDNRDLQSYLRGLLHDSYRVRLADDGVEGLAQARSCKPDLVLTDVMMPRLSGDELLRALRADPELCTTPVIFLTARAGTEARVESLAAGADDYLAKPFHEGELLARVRNLLRASAQKRELAELNRRLEARVEQQMAELVRTGDLRRFLSPEVAESVLAGKLDAANRFARLRITILFADLVGFTSLTDRLEPEEISALLNEFLRETTAAAVAHGGTVDKFIGDAVMVMFGAPREVEVAEQALAAVRTALGIRAAVARLATSCRGRGLPAELGVRIGLNTGYCTVGVFGSELLQSYTAIGTPVNIAARLQAQAPAGGILCALPTYAAVRSQVRATVGRPLSLHGLSDPVEVYEIHGLAAESGRAAAGERGSVPA